eukprot:100937-Pelagomonas_calceolata.AAC.9
MRGEGGEREGGTEGIVGKVLCASLPPRWVNERQGGSGSGRVSAVIGKGKYKTGSETKPTRSLGCGTSGALSLEHICFSVQSEGLSTGKTAMPSDPGATPSDQGAPIQS